MRSIVLVALLAVVAQPVAAQQVAPCDPMAGLIRLARNDFQSLKMKKFDNGKCVFRGQEFRCEWSFPGDSYAIAEAQSEKVKRCALAAPRVTMLKATKDADQLALEEDLTLTVARPELDVGDWKVRLKILAAD